MANECTGMSGLDHASGAGDRSSVFVSPGTLNTTTSIFSWTLGLLVNHSRLRPRLHHALRVRVLLLLGELLHVVKGVEHQQGVLQRGGGDGARSSSSRAATSPAMLYPPCMVPSSSTARSLDTKPDLISPFATWVSQLALT